MDFEFNGELWYWRGPAPWYFVTVPADQCEVLKAILSRVTYGWGMIPVSAQVGQTVWQTAMFPKDGRYLLPIKARIRQAEDLAEGDMVSVRITVQM
ncbi:MAG: DUF1905 domain-containing protein [Caldilineaceae bacterium]